MNEQDLSVVIAAWPDTNGLDECLACLERQRSAACEVIVVSTSAPTDALRRRFEWVHWHRTTTNILVPEMWREGIARSRGRLVAITTSQFIPNSDWIEQLRRAQARSDSAAVGGPIRPPRGGSSVDWAVFFLRYGRYVSHDAEKRVLDLPGDNASYKRAALDQHPEFMRDGFWEAELHRRLVAEGATLTFVPEIVVTQRASIEFWSFLRQRFRHGIRFGQSRAIRWTPWMRAIAVASLPAIPLVLMGKTLWWVVRARREVGALARCAPILACFVIAWSLGEWLGYLCPESNGAGKRRFREAIAT